MWFCSIQIFSIVYGKLKLVIDGILNYIVCRLGMEGKKYGIKKLITSATNVVVTYMQLLHGTYAILS